MFITTLISMQLRDKDGNVFFSENNITAIFSLHVLNEEYVTLNLVLRKRKIICFFVLEQSETLSDPNNSNFAKQRMQGRETEQIISVICRVTKHKY